MKTLLGTKILIRTLTITFGFGIALGIAVVASPAVAKDKAEFKVGMAARDITPPTGIPMWGYGDRHADLSEGVLDPLFAKAVVIQAGDDKVAIVGLDIGRGPTIEMMKLIRKELSEKAGIENVMISGSHTHHGPVIELTDREGYGKGKFDKAVEYAEQFPHTLIEVILEADAALQPAKIGVGTKNVALNRNRHTKRLPKATDPMLAVMRFDYVDGNLIGVLVNFAAHPTSIDSNILKYSADYVGAMHKTVEEKLGAQSIFMQGAAGDQSSNSPQGVNGYEEFGAVLGDEVVEIAKGIETTVPEEPSIKGKVDHFTFNSRINFSNPWIRVAFGRAFFPELVANFGDEMNDGVQTELNTVVLNGNLALVGGSGEFFCNHSNRLKERSYIDHTLFFGYCNGHNLYFPTIEAVSEGGYGADPPVSPVEIGAGEEMMNQALINIYVMLGKLAPPETPAAESASK